VLFTRRPWRKQGVGAALLRDSLGRFWERGEHSVGLSVDSASDTGAFRLYERAGMAPVLGWTAYEKELGAQGTRVHTESNRTLPLHAERP
jgi:GNAT superfamily N-acetyltransferase